jgi:phosphatidylinositol phospholipase C delta
MVFWKKKKHNEQEIKLNPTEVEENLQLFKNGYKVLCICKHSKDMSKPKDRIIVLAEDHSHFDIFDQSRKTKKECMFLKDVQRIVTGDSVADGKLKKYLHKHPDKKSLSFIIEYGSVHSTLDIICNSQNQYDMWINMIKFLRTEAYAAYEQDPVKIMLLKQWMKADENHDNKLDFKEIKHLCHTVNLTIGSKELQEKFDEFDADKNGTMEYEEFVKFYKHLSRRPEIEEVFNKFSSNDTKMTVSEFIKFMQESQGTTITQEQAKEIFSHYAVTTNENEPTINKEEFTRYVSSNDNMIVDKIIYEHDESLMDYPLTDYWMESSHNTYLVGHQLKGESSSDMYRQVLLRGCRCVELDCWDGKDGNPIIFHGHTLTTKVLFRDVIACIKEYAFVNSQYPVVLSLETHCSVEQQDKMADILVEILGDMILKPTDIDNGSIKAYPSPKSLKGKILIKGKRLTMNIEGNQEHDDHDEEEEETDTEFVAEEIGDLINEPNTSPNSDLDVKIKHGSKSTLKHGVSQKLSDITYLSTQPFKSKLTTEWFKMHSFSETKVEKLIKSNCADIVHYNRTNFSRIYPKGTRFASTNYDPTLSWMLGCQMVALNYQTHDDGMRLNQIWFERNGRCGYVPKPELLRNKNVRVDFTTSKATHHFKLCILSAIHIPKPHESEKGEVIDPFVAVSVKGPNPDNSIEFKTQTVWDNGFHPVWKETFEFDIHHIDLSYLRFVVYDANKTTSSIFLCENVFPIDKLRSGLRCIPLRSEEGNLVEACNIIVDLQITELK